MTILLVVVRIGQILLALARGIPEHRGFSLGMAGILTFAAEDNFSAS